MNDPNPNDISSPDDSRRAEQASDESVGATSGVAPAVRVDVDNPLSEPYRTGSYLIFDIPTGQPENYRTTSELQPNPYPASGSHQLNAAQMTQMLSAVVTRYKPRDLFLVDLREETHGFIDGNAVSWYADNDFGNVGVAPSLIERDEQVRLEALEHETTQIFTIRNDPADNRGQQRVMPVVYQTITRVVAPATERSLFDEVQIGNCTVHYLRIPVTDHCAPSAVALRKFRDLAASCDRATSWVHFHCHGGDGRTTTFLALYDMMCWKRWSTDPFPDLETFATRQYGLPPHYCLNPNGCRTGSPPPKPTDQWKHPLAVKRWETLQAFHDQFLDGP
jgi:hypothetical protein